MSAPPSITIDHIQVAEIEKNTMTISIEISGENIGQRTVETTTLLDTGTGGEFLDQNFVQNQKIKTKDLKHPIEVFNVDRTPNKQGTIVTFFTFLPYFTFTPSSFHHDYLIPLLQGDMAIHVRPL